MKIDLNNKKDINRLVVSTGDREDSNCAYLPVGVKELMSPNETTKECIGLRLQEKSSLPVVQPSSFLVQSNNHLFKVFVAKLRILFC